MYDAPNKGFTLIELLIGLAISVILASVALPSFADLRARMLARSATSELVSAVQLARNVAVIQRVSVTLCPMTETDSRDQVCSVDTPYKKGFGVVVVPFPSHQGPNDQVPRDQDPTTQQARLLRWYPPFDNNVLVLNRVGTAPVMDPIQWNRSGEGNRNMSLSVCVNEVNRAVVINRLGRPRLVDDWGACPP